MDFNDIDWAQRMEEKERFALIGERVVRQQEAKTIDDRIREQAALLLQFAQQTKERAPLGNADWLEREIGRLRTIHADSVSLAQLRARIRELDTLIG